MRIQVSPQSCQALLLSNVSCIPSPRYKEATRYIWWFGFLSVQHIFSLLIFHLCIFFHEVSLSLSPISWSLAHLFPLDLLDFFFYILDTSSLPDMCFMKIFSQSVACLLNFLMECSGFYFFLNMQIVLYIVSISLCYNNFLLSTF